MMGRDPSISSVLRISATPRYVIATIVIAYLLYLLPLPIWLRPHLPLLVLIHWCLHEPRKVGHAAAFFVGLMMDVADGMLLGQHALTYLIVIHLAQMFRVRILSFKLWQQALHVLLFLLVGQLVALILSLFIANALRPGWLFFLSSFIGALLWPAIFFVLELPRSRVEAEEASRAR